MHLAEPQHDHAAQFGFVCNNTIGGTPQPNPWEDDWVTFFREHRLRHQLNLAGNARLNQLAEPLLRPGALECFFQGLHVKPSVLHGERFAAVQRDCPAGNGPNHGAGPLLGLPLSPPRVLGMPPTHSCLTHVLGGPAGDLWSGNIAAVDGAPAIFDPATYYGHSEAEFGMR
jgi:fructosamine-3-kinase